MIDWNGTRYSSLAAFRTATGQESRGIEADPRFRSSGTADFHLLAGSRAIDSANSGASGQPGTDFDGNGRVDDPATTEHRHRPDRLRRSRRLRVPAVDHASVHSRR